MFVHGMSNAKFFIRYANMNAAIWWCKWGFCYANVLYEDANANVCTCNASVFYEDANANVYVYALWCICLWCMKLPQHDIVDVNATKWWCKWELFFLQISCRKMHMWMLCMWCKCLNQYSWKFKNSLQHFCSKTGYLV